MNVPDTDDAPDRQALDGLLGQAVIQHQAGNLAEAETLYRSILARQPGHPDANHNLGILIASTGQVAAALPHFQAALQANPNQGQFWLSCIDALIQLSQLGAARKILNLGVESGLSGAAVDSLRNRLQSPASALPPAATVAGSTNTLEHEPPSAFERSDVGSGSAQRQEAKLSKNRKKKGAPNRVEDWYNLGQMHEAKGAIAEAEDSYRGAIRIRPRFYLAYCGLAEVLIRQGRIAEAESCYRQVLEIKPDLAEAHNNLAILLNNRGSFVESEASCRRALELKPELAEAHNNLALVLNQMGRLAEAEASCRRVLELRPEFAVAHNNLATLLDRQGRFVEAEASCRQALKLKPDLAEAHYNLSTLLERQGLIAEAEASCRRALELAPNFAEAHNHIGIMLSKEGRFKEAEANFRRAIELKPALASAHSNLSNVLRSLNRPGDSEASCRRALDLNPDFADAHLNLGTALMDLGRLAEAAASFRRALQIQPNLPAAHQDLLFCLSHDEETAQEALFDEHLRFADRFEAPLRQAWPRHQNPREPERQLRVGFVSGDFREHALAHFMEPVFSHLAHNAGLSLHAYSNNPAEDAVTSRMRGHVAHWSPVFGLSDEMLAEKVRADGIDILVDFTGHTAHSRLLAFARKPAPIQCGWIGYLGTSGLQSIDYYLADKYFLPPGEFDRYFTEKIVYLPAVAPFQPSFDSPPVAPLPMLANGHLTLGSFSRLSKLSPRVIALWSQLLRALPQSQMLVAGMPHDGQHHVVESWFKDQGIASERLQFHTRSDNSSYLALHHQVDFCLDPFPFTGATTTSHALWMGVPTLTLVGRTVPGRLGAALLRHVGLDDFVAYTPEEFIEKGIYWAAHPELLARLRAGMRDRFLQSPIGQPDMFAQSLAASFRHMWQTWCASRPDPSQ